MANEKVLNIINHLGNKNENHNETPAEGLKIKIGKIMFGEDIEQLEFIYCSWSGSQYNHSGKLLGSVN